MEEHTQRTKLWWAIQNRKVHELSKDTLNPEILSATNSNGENALHCAIKIGHLDQIPKNLITKEDILKGNAKGETPLTIAANRDQFSNIPPRLLTSQNLLHQTDKTNPTDCAIFKFCNPLGLTRDEEKMWEAIPIFSLVQILNAPNLNPDILQFLKSSLELHPNVLKKIKRFTRIQKLSQISEIRLEK